MTSKYSLGSLYREALAEAGLDASQCSFQGPLLRQHGINRILFYPGSFNPPHKGHVQLLRHAFENAGEDLHIAGGVILPIDDERLQNKMRAKQYGFVLKKAQRIELLEKSGMPGNTFWVFGFSEKDWTSFQAALIQVCSKAKLDVKLVMLAGPDGVKIEGAPDPVYWNCPDVITTDVSRSANFRTPNGLVQISDYQGWSRVSCDMDRLRSQMRARLRGQTHRGNAYSPNHLIECAVDSRGNIDIEAAVQAAASKIQVLWVCYRQRKPKGWVRFIPADISQQPPEGDAPSSTKLRKIMAMTSDDKLEAELKGWAVSVELLVRFVREAKKRGDIFEQAPIVESPLYYDPSKVKW